MPKFPVKLDEDKYVLWSTVVDAPISGVMTKTDMFMELLQKGYWCVESNPFGTDKNMGYTWDGLFWVDNSVLAFNRAGPNEEHASREEILQMYQDV